MKQSAKKKAVSVLASAVLCISFVSGTAMSASAASKKTYSAPANLYAAYHDDYELLEDLVKSGRTTYGELYRAAVEQDAKMPNNMKKNSAEYRLFLITLALLSEFEAAGIL